MIVACHLKNYFCFYRLPTRGRAGTKLGDADTSQTYLSFLMFHACFIPIATCFASTLCHFYTFFGTNLLTRCRSASSCFLLFLYSRKASLEIFSELDETSRGMLFCQNTPEGPKEQRRGATGAPHATRARPRCQARPRVVWAPRGSSATALSPTYSPMKKP